MTIGTHRVHLTSRVDRLPSLYSFYGTTLNHVGEQWFLEVWDFKKHAKRDFAMCSITEWVNR